MTSTTLGFSIGELAELAGVTVRTLHHYDRIGLVRPSHRTAAGYRCYTDADADRLAQILGYRELGFGLEAIRTILDEPDTDPANTYAGSAGCWANASTDCGASCPRSTPHWRHRRWEPRDSPQPRSWRCSGTSIPMITRRRLSNAGARPTPTASQPPVRKGHTKAEWVEITAEGTANTNALAEAMTAGLPATSTEAMDAAEQARQHISRWFYDCPAEMHRNLGDMYIADERFTATYEKVAPSLASYVPDAIHANADRAEA